MIDRVVTMILSNPRADRLVLNVMVAWLVVLVARQLVGGI